MPRNETPLMESFGDNIVQECERLGVPQVRYLHSMRQFHILDMGRVSAWLSKKEAEASARSEARSEESLSISRQALRNSDKALSNSRLATSIAISAIVLSIIMAIQKLIEWFSR